LAKQKDRDVQGQRALMAPNEGAKLR